MGELGESQLIRRRRANAPPLESGRRRRHAQNSTLGVAEHAATRGDRSDDLISAHEGEDSGGLVPDALASRAVGDTSSNTDVEAPPKPVKFLPCSTRGAGSRSAHTSCGPRFAPRGRVSKQADPSRPTIILACAPAEFGGLESVVISLATGLQRAGVVVHVAVTVQQEIPPVFAEALRESGVAVVPVRVTTRDYAGEIRALKELVVRVGAVALHSHGYRSDFVACIASRATGRRWVSTAHGFIGGSIRGRFYEWLQRRAWRSATAVIAVSEKLQRQIVRSGVPAEQVRLLPNALPIRCEVDGQAARQALGLPEGPVVGWIGRMSHEKGPDVAVAAWCGVDAPHALLAMIGAGPMQASLASQAQGAGARVRWVGMVPDAARYLRAFDVLLLSSRTEGTPVVLLEAMHAGVPIVATDVGGVRALLGETALLVESENSRGLAQACARLLDSDIERARFAVAAHARVRTQFDHARWIDAHRVLYTEGSS